MRDVARHAGVSLKTVSRVVNGENGVRPDTAAKVNAAIEALGFRRNDLARVLKQGRLTRSLGLVIEDVGNPFYSQVVRGVEEVARGNGYLVISGSSDEDPERERELVRSLCERRVDGLLIVPADGDHRWLLPELRMGIQAVFLDRPPGGGLQADAVLIDNVGGAHRAVEHLVAQGHRRIAFVGDSPRVWTATERYRGYVEALAGHGLALDESIVRFGPRDVAGAEAVTGELLALGTPPTAVFAGNNRLAIGALRAIHAAGRPVALVGFDDFELAGLLATPVTVVAHSPAEMGRRGAELLCRRLEGERLPPQRVLLPTELIARGSGEVAPPGQAAPAGRP
jgi:LacI family transcriptional regulator